MLDKILSVLASNPVNKLVDTVTKYFPPDMDAQQKAQIEQAIRVHEHQKEMALREAAHQQTVEFNQRIKDLEGTAADLKSLPYIGKLIIFMRGSQRPVWGFFTMWMDYKIMDAWVTGSFVIEPMIFRMALIINILVLGFLFGERAIKNVMPLITPLISSLINKNRQQ
jgi:hypothetical protein